MKKRFNYVKIYIINFNGVKAMNKNNIINKVLWLSVAIALVLAILTAVFGFTSENAFSKVMLLIVSALFLALTGMVGYLAYLDTFKVASTAPRVRRRLNYFLNANNNKRGIAPEDLTFEIVDSQMNKYVIDTFGSPVALWQNQVFAEEGVFGNEDCFKVLVAYKMVYDLQAHHSKKIWRMFFELSDVDFSDLHDLLVRNGDEEFARTLGDYKLTGMECVGEASAFLDENATYLQRRMLNYVLRKIDLFDI